MNTITIKTYTYDELKPEAQEKAREIMADINTDYEWYEPLLDEVKEELKESGYEDAEVQFSGFWSQGDGASFSCTVNIKTWLEKRKGIKKNHKRVFKDADNWNIIIKTSGHYSHEYSMHLESEYNGEDKKNEDDYGNLDDIILNEAREEARSIYKRLEKEYDFQTSEDAIVETIRSNDCAFLEDGTRTMHV